MAVIAQQIQKIISITVLAILVTACGKQEPAAQAMPAMPVSILEMKATSVPISAEAVAQTEGAKEVEIVHVWAGFCSRKCLKRVRQLKRDNLCF